MRLMQELTLQNSTLNGRRMWEEIPIQKQEKITGFNQVIGIEMKTKFFSVIQIRFYFKQESLFYVEYTQLESKAIQTGIPGGELITLTGQDFSKDHFYMEESEDFVEESCCSEFLIE